MRNKTSRFLHHPFGAKAASFAISISCAVLCGCSPESWLSGPTTGPLANAVLGEYVLTWPGGTGDAGSAESLRAAAQDAGLFVEHQFSDRVGLEGGLSVSGSATQLAQVAAHFPTLRIASAVWRLPFVETCGDGLCDGTEPATPLRGSLCSLDCGALPPKSERNELDNTWQVRAVSADRIWPQTKGEFATVCILDTGFDQGPVSVHPDKPIGRLPGKNLVTGGDNDSDISFHGTHVTGIVAAAQNGVGAVGVAPKASVRMYQVFRLKNGSPVATDADVIAALDAAIRDGCSIVNLSLGGAGDSEAERRAFRKAYQSGVLIVAAAGNGEDATRGIIRTAQGSFPGAYAESFTVGAIDRAGSLARFSGTGAAVGISAPGVGVYSTVPQGFGQREVLAHFANNGRPFSLTVGLPSGSSGTELPETPVVSCGFGSPADFVLCKPSNQAALIERGPGGPGETALSFYDKIRGARQAGATAVLLYNHRYGDAATAGEVPEEIELGTGHPIAVLSLAAGDGEALAKALTAAPGSASDRITVSAQIRSSPYLSLDGTSMAAPVVSGVAALLWSKNRTLTNVALRQLLSESAVDLGAPGRDEQFGAGRVDAERALSQFSPRARCGDGIRQRDSELCDGRLVEPIGCDELGYDGVLGGSPGCNSTCTGLAQGTCQCVPGRTPFFAKLTVLENQTQHGLLGTRFLYHIELKGRPVEHAGVVVTFLKDGAPKLVYQTAATDHNGNTEDFVPSVLTSLPTGEYQVSPKASKGDGICRDDQPTQPPQVTVSIRSGFLSL